MCMRVCAQLVAGALALARSALDLIDLRRHSATHPRLGALDHISVHHLSLTNRCGFVL